MTTEESIKIFEAWAECKYRPTHDAAVLALSALRAQKEREHPMTNADRIRAMSDRAMSDEELAKNRCVEIRGLDPYPIFVAFDVPKKRFLSIESAAVEELNWLQQPAEEG